MLLQRHYLQDIVAQGLYPREHRGPELFEGGHLLLLGTHADVAFIDERMRSLARASVLPLIRFRVPYLGTENLGLRVLNHPGRIRRKPFRTAARPLYPELVQISVMKADFRQPDFPVALSHRFQGITVGALPVVEIPYKVDAARIRCPFAQNPFGSFLMERVVKMVVDRSAQGAFAGKLALLGKYPFVSCIYRRPERLKPGISLVNSLVHTSRSILVLKKAKPFPFLQNYKKWQRFAIFAKN